MNSFLKNSFGKWATLKPFRTLLTYLIIFSLLLQNGLWATGPFQILKEDLETSRARIYGNSKVGIVEPGSIKHNAVHNVFKGLNLPEDGGFIFKGGKVGTIYNRVYNDDSIHLSGTIQSDSPTAMVFGNRGGISLENIQFRNIHSLTLAAGEMAQTDKGMAYGVETGKLKLTQTVLDQENDLNHLALGGRTIRLKDSLLCPSETLNLTAGRFEKGLWDPIGALRRSSEEDKLSPAPKHGISIHKSAILRSKSLFLRSLEEGASINVKGLLQSTEEDIIIHARGDVYINKLIAARNLFIETTGKVYINDEAFVGGLVSINGQNIHVGKKLSSVGQLFLKASKHLKIEGSLFSHTSLHVDAEQTENEGSIETNGELATNNNFYNHKSGTIKAKNLLKPLAVLSRNKGKVELEDSIVLSSNNDKLEGVIKTSGQFTVDGSALTINGKVSALKGTHFDLKTLTNKGTLSAFGGGLKGKISELINEGKIDLSHIDVKIFEKMINRKTGIIRNSGHSILQGNHYNNEGKIFTCGVHQANFKGSYEDSGTFYSPTLFLLQASTAIFFPRHTSYVKDGIIRTDVKLNIGGYFQIDSHGSKSFLQLKSQGNLTQNGELKQFSTSRFPLLEYFEVFKEQPSLNYENFAENIQKCHLGSWKETKKSLGSGIVLQAGRDIHCQGSIHAESGSVSLIAEGKINTEKVKIASGYFKGNDVSAKGKIAFLKDSVLISLFGKVSVIAQEEMTLIGSQLQGKKDTSLFSNVLEMNNSSLESQEEDIFVHTKTSTNINHSNVNGKNTYINGGKKLSLSHSTLEGEYNRFTGNEVDVFSTKTKGTTLIEGKEKVKAKEFETDKDLFVFSKHTHFSDNINANNITAQGEKIKNTGNLNSKKNLKLEGNVIEQKNRTTSVNKTIIRSAQQYIDTFKSHNEAGNFLFLFAETTEGFKGTQKARDTVVIKLKDMNLLALLNQTDAPDIKVHLKEGEVSFYEDVLIKQNLKLWAQSLENKKKMTTCGNFIAHIQKSIMNEGSMMIGGKGLFESKETLLNVGKIESEGDLFLKAKTAIFERLVKRESISGGYQDILQGEVVTGSRTGSLEVNTEDLLQAQGAKFKAKLNVNLKSEGRLYLGAQQTTSEVTFSGEDSYYHRFTLTNHPSEIEAGENIKVESGKEGMLLRGLNTISGKDTRFKSEGKLENRSVQNIFQEESKTTTDEGFWGDKKTETRQRETRTVLSNKTKSGGNISYESIEDNIQQAPHMESEGSTTIQSHQGKVYLLSDKSYDMISEQNVEKSLLWQSQESKGHVHETVEMLQILAKGGVHILGAKGIEVDVKAGGSLTTSLDTLEQDEKFSWIKELRKNSNVKWNLISEKHEEWDQKVQGLTGAASAVIALAVTIFTGGIGAGAATLLQAMGTAALQNLITTTTISLINNQGDIGKTFKDLHSSQQLLSLGISLASLGITRGLSTQLKIPTQPTTLMGHIQKNLLQTAVSTGSSIAQGQNPKEAFQNALRSFAANTIGGFLANKIGKTLSEHPILHKFAHGGLGAFQGIILDKKNPLKGAAAGALGGILSEVISEALPDTMDLGMRADLGRLGSSVAALLSGQDVNITLSTATNAVENNFMNNSVPKEGEKKEEDNEPNTQGTKERNDDFEKAERDFQEASEALADPNLSYFEKMGWIELRNESLEKMSSLSRLCKAVTTEIESLVKIQEELSEKAKNQGKEAWNSFNDPGSTFLQRLGWLEDMRDSGYNQEIAQGIPTTPLEVGLSVLDVIDLAGQFKPVVKLAVKYMGKGGQKLLSFGKDFISSKVKNISPENFCPYTPLIKTHYNIDVLTKNTTVAEKSCYLLTRNAHYAQNVGDIAIAGTYFFGPEKYLKGFPKITRTTKGTNLHALNLAEPSYSLVTLNRQAGRKFQDSVHKYLKIPENKIAYRVSVPGKGEITTIPDLPITSTWDITDIKNVQKINFTKQLRAQAELANELKKSFNLVISPNTRTISRNVWDAVRKSEGKIFEFNPTTEKMIERIVDGNKVLR